MNARSFLVAVLLFFVPSNAWTNEAIGLDAALGIGFFRPVGPSHGLANTTGGYGQMPSPLGVGFVPSLGVSICPTKRLVCRVQYGYAVMASDYRTNRRAYRPPGWGEAYTYSMITQLQRQSLDLGWLSSRIDKDMPWGKQKVKTELGLRLSIMQLRVEQGLDAWTRRQPIQSFRGKGYGLGLYYRRDDNLEFELGPIGPLDFGRFGKSTMLSSSLAFHFGS